MRFMSILLCVGALGASIEAQQRPTKTLDLTIPASATLGPPSTSKTVGGGASSGAGSVPLRLTLRRLDSDFYRQADPLVFEVLLENVGDRAVRLPWSRYQAYFADHPLSETVRADLSLRLVDEKGVPYDGPGLPLMGIVSDETTSVLRRTGGHHCSWTVAAFREDRSLVEVSGSFKRPGCRDVSPTRWADFVQGDYVREQASSDT
jgi:hypothetical protein